MRKLYVAVLNKGWLRREYFSTIFPVISRTKGVQIVFEDPDKTYAHPICSNRSLITKRFLETDCTHLLMLDCDVVPIHNPAELVFADRDIIGSPARVRRGTDDNAFTLDWVAYIKTEDGGHISIPLETIDAKIDLLEVDVVGTGCIVIKREVLEKLGPKGWLIEFDDDGKCIRGTDFAFCKRAKEAGFHIYTTPNRLCEHIKELGMLELESRANISGMYGLAAKYQMSWGGWSITAKDWQFIKNIIMEENDIETILEFGSGLSSLLMSELAAVNSFETNEDWANEIISKRTEQNNLIILPWNGENCRPPGSEYDLVFIDGPPGKCNGGIGREAAIKIAKEHSDRIILHDSGRVEETELQAKYLRDDFRRVLVNGFHAQRCAYWKRRESL